MNSWIKLNTIQKTEINSEEFGIIQDIIHYYERYYSQQYFPRCNIFIEAHNVVGIEFGDFIDFEILSRILFLTHLNELSISECELHAVPDIIGNFQSLKILKLRYNPFQYLPRTIKKLVNLEELALTETKLQCLPDEIGYLQKLKIIDLSETKISELPQTFGVLQNLEIIEMEKCDLIRLPYHVNMPNLEHLILAENFLRTIPADFFLSTKLEWIYLRKNRLITFPKTISSKVRLIRLNLSENYIKEFELDEIQSFIEINLNYNELQAIPKIQPPSFMKYLHLDYNQIKEIPIWIQDYRNLTYLSLRKNYISTLPQEFAHLLQLTYLDLSFNQITRIPECVLLLKSLKHLNLRGNLIRDLDSRLLHLQNLQYLNIQDLPLNSLPNWLADLSQLQVVDIDWDLKEALISANPRLDYMKVRWDSSKIQND